jgi:uncharacterized glyoxalase superfamily protein PhnB
MIENLSMPPGTFIPELGYPDVAEAAAWLCSTFGLQERLRIGSHRIQLCYGQGSMVVVEQRGALPTATGRQRGHAIMMRVENVDRHYEQAVQQSAHILLEPTDYPYGERQYTAADLAGHCWTFSESFADVDPATWGGVLLMKKE